MKPAARKTRALGLCSGGLDSMLAALVLRRQGIEVAWVTFETPFFSAAKAQQASRATGVPLTVENITAAYLEMLVDPPCGYGQYMNPCMDCHALMFRLAGGMMQRRGFDFLFSGEVLGQRPMSQTRPSLRYVEKHSGFEGRILRPLSAKLLDETEMEKTGLVDRERLYGLSGRSRKPQIQLARQFGIRRYPQPAGGCLLTDKGYSARLKDLFAHNLRPGEAELHLLKHGRHFRFEDGTKVIVGRTKKDNAHILRHADRSRDTLIHLVGLRGPTVLVPGGAGERQIVMAAGLCAGYGKAPADRPAPVRVSSPQGRRVISAERVDPAAVRRFMV
jgi:tRNA U34 2-thiouridine synthase MnmA/TrmU